MRITNAQMTAQMQMNLNRNQEALDKLSMQIATGDRLQRPSDDPVASVRLFRIQREEASLAQFGKNIANVAGGLAMQETNLTSLSEAMMSVNDLVLSASNGAHSREDLAAIAGQLESLEQSILGYVNTRDGEGNYLFSGTKSRSSALILDPATDRYVLGGNDAIRRTPVANGVEIASNVTAEDFLGAGADLVSDLRALVKTLQSPTLDPADPVVKGQLSGMLTQFSQTHSSVLASITDMGGWQNTLTLLNETNEDLTLAHKKTGSDLSNLDYAEATMKLNGYQISIQASQKTYLKIYDLSLFSIL
jgi:flagellar hook-associated protein 3 FlgL